MESLTQLKNDMVKAANIMTAELTALQTKYGDIEFSVDVIKTGIKSDGADRWEALHTEVRIKATFYSGNDKKR